MKKRWTGVKAVVGEATDRTGTVRYRMLDTGEIQRVDARARRKRALKVMGMTGRQRRLVIKATRRVQRRERT